ncbi:uncharacterized protein LOC141607227 [Silene latifolia]|uniref:uncharacterized protein LOC141607227 n=1 Tax=Silene latifolia TaxID=37657 RepID=UPI003D76E253
MVGWEHVCCPKNEGGLGIRYSQTWNEATVGKLVWWIYSKPDSLWVKWVNQVYIKNTSWDTYLPKSHMSGNWKDICKTKELLKPGYSSGIWLAHLKGYNVSYDYEWLRRREQKVGWAKLVWDNWCMPKHSFLTWLVFRNALPLKDRLLRFGISQDDQCCICRNATETMVHLFQNCRFAVAILTKVADRLHIPMPAGNAVI